MLKRAEEQVEADHQRGIGGGSAAFADDINLRERLDRLDQSHYKIEEDDRREQRQRDMGEPANGPCAVDPSRLVKRLRDVADGGQVNHHEVAHAPEAHQDEGILRADRRGIILPCRRREGVRRDQLFRRGKPLRLPEAERTEDRIHEPIGWIQEPHPQDACRDDRNDRRQIKERAEDRLPADVAGKKRCQADPQNDRQGHRQKRVVSGVPQGMGNSGSGSELGGELFVVFCPHEARGIDQVVPAETPVKRYDKRIDEQSQESHQPGAGEANRGKPRTRMTT